MTQELKEGPMELLQLVSFNLGNEEFAVDILKVQEINRMVEITKVPRSPHFVEGVINLRGKVIPIVDLRKRFNLGEKDRDKQTRIVVVDVDNKTVGLVVDSVSEVLRLQSNTIEPPPPLVAGIDSEYINGVGKLEDRLLILLDLNKIFSKTEKEMLEAVEAA
jgi:purine-binding chemotaxis protein CheW